MAEALKKAQPYIDVDKNKFVEAVQEDVDEDFSDDDQSNHDSNEALEVLDTDNNSDKKDDATP